MILLGSNHYLSAGSTNTHSIDLEASSSQYLSITDASQTGLDITGDMTIEFWVKFETVPTDIRYLISKWLITGNQKSYILYQNGSTNKLVFINSPNGSSTPSALWSWTPSVNTWYHVAITLDVSATTAEFYLNGVSQGTDATVGSSTYNSNAPFEIGAYNGTQTLDGLIDDVRVWNDIRTSTEIANNYNKELTGTEANLQGYWQLNNSANDLTSNANDLTETNSPVYSTDVAFLSDTLNTHSIDLEASSSQYLSITDAAQTGLDLTGDFTIEYWANIESWTDTGGNGFYPITKYGSSGNYSYYIDMTSGNKVRLLISSNGTSTSMASWSITNSFSVWKHYAIVYDASSGQAELFINGVSQGTQTGLSTSIYNGTAPFQVGACTSLSRYADGLIDDVRVWNVIRTQEEISNNFNKELNGDETNLVAYWKLNNSPNDLTSNANHLTETNSPVYSTDTPF